MGVFECSFCRTKSSVQDSKRYKRCKLADGKPCIPCSKTIELDDLIAQARQNLEKLLHQKRDLYAEINFSHERIIHRLPPEVSTSIFLFSLSKVVPKTHFDSENPYYKRPTITTPLALGAVCRVWRNIIWTSPQMWTNITIPCSFDAPHDIVVGIAQEWLSRSGRLPLSMAIFAPQEDFGSPNLNLDMIDGLTSLMREYLSRCYRLEIFCPLSILPSISGNAPILEEFKITSDEDNEYHRRLELWSTKPEGVRVSVKGFYLGAVDLPFENVAEFEGVVTMAECVSTLEQSANLQECRILGLRRASEDEDLPSIITHDRLKKLALHSEEGSPSSPVLQALQLPSLTHLAASYIDTSSIRSFVLRSCCTLQSLSLESIDCEDGPQLSDILRSIPSLGELHLVILIQKYDLDIDIFLKDLAQSPVPVIGKTTDSYSGPPLLPNLSVLTIKFCGKDDLPWDQAAAIFGSIDDIRDPLRRPIKDFQMIYDRRIDGVVRARKVLGWDELPIEPAPLLDEEVTRRFLDISGEGVNITVYHAEAKSDFLRTAMVHHNIAIPDWYKPNVPPDDLNVKISANESDNSSDEESESTESTESESEDDDSELESDL